MEKKTPQSVGKPTLQKVTELVEGIDYTIENGYWVFTAKYLLERGYCCTNGCKNCPYPKE